MKRTLVLLLIALLCLALCAPGALAAPSLWARMEDGGLVASWTACNCAQAALTVYREDWPILAACVSGADGCFRVPAGYTQAAGRYAVQLRCAHGCARAEVESAVSATPAPTEEAAQTPRPQPSSTPAPTKCPAQTARPQPSSPAPAPTEEAAQTPRPQPSSTPAPTKGPAQTARPQPSSPAPAPTQSSGQERPALAEEVVRQVNQERAARGLSALAVDAELTRAAAVRAREIAGQFSHTRPDGSNWSTVSDAASGENIARGHDSVDRVMAAWMSSQGHRDNILRAGYSRIGVCAFLADGILHWVQLFGV